ncbi:thioredoxin-disulfide reductase [Roseomonas genomospecies 6]|uniref:Thioredoxin reductase n=1 Tax=Roseomonas genomospecies 6 TaxID=214106 RepID=A0A9W7NJC0_9PROT|nr:thioredoxin-disulfide reductase [Roseomonas genomospecies 6]KAA0680364.1 thioredoxin-disulfide reductase [Roseomonas genomospecies 6]
MSQTHRTKVLIIGSGPAGYTAAIYSARANLNPILVQGLQPGGQLTITTDVENYPGFAEAVQGPWLMEQMQKQAEHVGTKMMFDIITEVDFSKRPFICKGDSGDVYESDVVIIATGAQARKLGTEPEYLCNRGISWCAVCDGAFSRGKEVAVIGGGNTAVEEALYLSNLASKVTLIHRRDSLRAERVMQDRLFENPKIEVRWNTVVDEFLGSEATGLTGLRLRRIDTGELSDLNVFSTFVAIGHNPATELFRGQIDLDSDGYIAVKPGTVETNIPGVFAAGDVADKVYRQAVTAAGMGCMAALQAEKWLAETERMPSQVIA